MVHILSEYDLFSREVVKLKLFCDTRKIKKLPKQKF